MLSLEVLEVLVEMKRLVLVVLEVSAGLPAVLAEVVQPVRFVLLVLAQMLEMSVPKKMRFLLHLLSRKS